MLDCLFCLRRIPSSVVWWNNRSFCSEKCRNAFLAGYAPRKRSWWPLIGLVIATWIILFLLIFTAVKARGPPLLSRSCPVEMQYAHGSSRCSVAVGCSGTLLTYRYAECSSLCTEQVSNAQ